MTTVEEKLVLIDTDAGLDDTLAILMALRAHRDPKVPFRIIGITCVEGNTALDNVCVNVSTILKMMNATEIPVYRGAEVAMVIPYKHIFHPPHHGIDGFGDVPGLVKSDPKLEPENGIIAITRLAHEYKGKLSILALGPLTNLAMAVRLDPSIKDCIKNIFLMGGNVEGAGNITVAAEFNWYCDPEAVRVTLSTYTCPIIILPLELAQKRVTQTYDWRVNELGKFDTISCKLLNQIETNTLDGRWKTGGIWPPYDSTASAVIIEPKCIKTKINHHVTVELQGEHSRGSMIVDYKSYLGQPGNVTIVTDMNKTLFQKMMIWAVGGSESYED